jgi:pimeloyl-ACP methyl ester carboxylesterase
MTTDPFDTRMSRRALIRAAAAITMLGGAARRSRSAVLDGGGQLRPIAQGHDRQTADLGGVQVEVQTYKPSSWSGDGVLLHFHGLGSHPADELGCLTDLAERSGHMLVAPYFDRDRFPFWRYQAVGIAQQGSPRPRETWTGNLVVELLRQLEALEGPRMAVRLIGHSAGGQFVDRFAGFHAVPAARLIAANPASVLMPSRDYAYPYGFGRLPDSIAGDDTIAAYLRQPLVLYVGELDDQSQGTPDTNPEAMRQGETRPQRARLAFETGQALAQARGWVFNWRFVSRPGVGHNLLRMFAGSFAYDLVFKEIA